MSNVIAMPLANRLGQLIEDLNREFAVISVGSSIKILRERADPVTGEIEITFLSPWDFNTATRNRLVADLEAGSVSKYFLNHPKRREYRKIDFYPGKVSEDVYNLFRGFPVKPVAGVTQKFWTFVRNVICDNDYTAYRFVRCWLAHLIQYPAKISGTALVLRGKQGTGKNTFGDTIGKLVGHHFIAVNSLEQITGRFNGHLANKLLVHANEAIWGGNKSSEGALKAIVTDEWLPLEYKGVDMINIRNFKRLIVSSNEEWAVPRGCDDRRFFVLDVSDSQKENQDYFGAIHKELNEGGLSALMHDLLAEDLTDFNPRVMPISAAGLDMKLKSASSTIRWLFEFLDSGYRYQAKHHNSSILEDMLIPDTCSSTEKSHLYESYRLFCSTDHTRPEMNSQFFKNLKQAIPELRDSRLTGADGSRARSIVLPPLTVARTSFEYYFKQPGMIPWTEPVKHTPAVVQEPTKKAA